MAVLALCHFVQSCPVFFIYIYFFVQNRPECDPALISLVRKDVKRAHKPLFLTF